MKHDTRKTLVQVERMNDVSFRADHARDVLASDDRQREELHRLREVLKRIAADACGDPCPDYSMCDGCQARAVLKRRTP